jgi:hypothetical protein
LTKSSILDLIEQALAYRAIGGVGDGFGVGPQFLIDQFPPFLIGISGSYLGKEPAQAVGAYLLFHGATRLFEHLLVYDEIRAHSLTFLVSHPGVVGFLYNSFLVASE